MKFVQWLMLRWRADRLRSLAMRAFARGRLLQQKADACDAKADALTADERAQ